MKKTQRWFRKGHCPREALCLSEAYRTSYTQGARVTSSAYGSQGKLHRGGDIWPT